ncbi:MAG: ribosome maturation factor RimM [Anaerolineae bacterium]
MAVGRIGRAHGVRGEVRVDSLTDVPEVRFAPGSVLYIGKYIAKTDGDALRRVTVVSSREHRDVLLVRFDTVEDREEAQLLTGSHAYVPLAELADPGPDAYYEHELIGLAVVTDSGDEVGAVTGLIETGAADVLVIDPGESGIGVKLVPMTGEVINEIDTDGGKIVISPLPGLLD